MTTNENTRPLVHLSTPLLLPPLPATRLTKIRSPPQSPHLPKRYPLALPSADAKKDIVDLILACQARVEAGRAARIAALAKAREGHATAIARLERDQAALRNRVESLTRAAAQQQEAEKQQQQQQGTAEASMVPEMASAADKVAAQAANVVALKKGGVASKVEIDAAVEILLALKAEAGMATGKKKSGKKTAGGKAAGGQAEPQEKAAGQGKGKGKKKSSGGATPTSTTAFTAVSSWTSPTVVDGCAPSHTEYSWCCGDLAPGTLAPPSHTPYSWPPHNLADGVYRGESKQSSASASTSSSSSSSSSSSASSPSSSSAGFPAGSALVLGGTWTSRSAVFVANCCKADIKVEAAGASKLALPEGASCAVGRAAGLAQVVAALSAGANGLPAPSSVGRGWLAAIEAASDATKASGASQASPLSPLGWAALDHALATTAFLGGDVMTGVDLAAFWCVHPFLEDGHHPVHYPSIFRWLCAVRRSSHYKTAEVAKMAPRDCSFGAIPASNGPASLLTAAADRVVAEPAVALETPMMKKQQSPQQSQKKAGKAGKARKVSIAKALEKKVESEGAPPATDAGLAAKIIAQGNLVATIQKYEHCRRCYSAELKVATATLLQLKADAGISQQQHSPKKADKVGKVGKGGHPLPPPPPWLPLEKDPPPPSPFPPFHYSRRIHVPNTYSFTHTHLHYSLAHPPRPSTPAPTPSTHPTHPTHPTPTHTPEGEQGEGAGNEGRVGGGAPGNRRGPRSEDHGAG
jgi:hypothetical protein